MSIDSFLTQYIDDVRQIIRDLKNEKFSSHQFIQKFAQRFERDYIEFLYHYRMPNGQRGAFHKVHTQIGKFLSKNKDVLHIEKTNRTDTQNIFGDDSDNQEWRRL